MTTILKGVTIAIMILLCLPPLKAQETAVLEWAKSFGAILNGDYATAITTDALGNAYSTGRFFNTVDFDPGPGVFNLTGTGFNDEDAFILKLDNDGNFVWARALVGSSNCETDVNTIDAAGNIYTAGLFSGTIDFDPGSGVFELTREGTFSNTFVSKLDTDGNFEWAIHFANSFGQRIAGMVTDAAQNVYVLGHFRGTVDFETGPGVTDLAAVGEYDAFLAKLDVNGNLVWIKQISGTEYEFGGSVSMDALGNIYISGVFQGTPDFDPGADTFNLTSAGERDPFIAKLDSDGDFVWARSIGSANDELGWTVKADASGNIYASGIYEGTLDVDPGPATFNLTTSGGRDSYILRLDSNGDFVWGKTFGSATFDDGVYGLDIDATGIYTTGTFQGTADLDPGPGVYNIAAPDGAAFIVKLDLNGNFVFAVSFRSTTSLTRDLVVDAAGNMYSIARFNPPVDVDPNPCVDFYLETGVFYIQKLSIGTPSEPCGQELEIYNAVSANADDDINRVFTILNIDVLPDTQENRVTIFNRWGDVVFEITNYNNTDRAFTGQDDNGKDLPSGTYFYKIEFASKRKVETGFLSLKR